MSRNKNGRLIILSDLIYMLNFREQLMHLNWHQGGSWFFLFVCFFQRVIPKNLQSKF